MPAECLQAAGSEFPVLAGCRYPQLGARASGVRFLRARLLGFGAKGQEKRCSDADQKADNAYNHRDLTGHVSPPFAGHILDRRSLTARALKYRRPDVDD